MEMIWPLVLGFAMNASAMDSGYSIVAETATLSGSCSDSFGNQTFPFGTELYPLFVKLKDGRSEDGKKVTKLERVRSITLGEESGRIITFSVGAQYSYVFVIHCEGKQAKVVLRVAGPELKSSYTSPGVMKFEHPVYNRINAPALGIQTNTFKWIPARKEFGELALKRSWE